MTSRAADRRSPQAAAYRGLYSTPRWRALRRERLAAHPLCEMCLGDGRTVAATVVNHRTRHRGDLALMWDEDNLQSLCKPHHDGPIQREEKRGVSGRVDASGYPTDPRHRACMPSAAPTARPPPTAGPVRG